MKKRKRNRRVLASLSGAIVLALILLAWPRKHRFENDSCRRAYESLFRNPELEVRVVFGYKDARPARFVGDRYETLYFITRIQRRCEGNEVLCDFARDRKDPELFTKKITGPDGWKKLVRLEVIHSSVSPDDQANRADPFQRWQSRHAQTSFLEGFHDADILFYDGHSRDGGGPDFSPPHLASDRHVDYKWYQEKKKGLEDLLGAIRGTPTRARILGLFSCSSSEHFSREIRKADGDLGILSSRYLLYYSDALESSLDSLSGILKMQCQPEFRDALQRRANRAGTDILGFFRHRR